MSAPLFYRDFYSNAKLRRNLVRRCCDFVIKPQSSAKNSAHNKFVNIVNLKKNFLYAFIVSIALSALLGIFATLTGTLDKNGKILLTAVTITAASFSMFINGIFIERAFGKILPFIGFSLTLVATVLSLTTIWTSNDFRPFSTVMILLFANFCLFPFAFYYEERRKRLIPLFGVISTLCAALLAIAFIWFDKIFDAYFKHFTIFLIFAAACFYLSLVLIVPLAKKYSWAMITVQAAVWLLAFMLCTVIIFDKNENSLFELILMRLTVILAISVAALTILIPIFYRLSLSELAVPEKLSLEEIENRIRHHKDRIFALEEMKRGIVESSHD